MKEVEIKFEREDREGLIAVGSYLIDTARRFGIRFEEVCSMEAGTHFCAVTIKKGADLLSSETKAESQYFRETGRDNNERLACQVKIEKPGEVVVMTKKTEKEEPAPEVKADDREEQFRKEFAEMPFEKKIANLVQLETIALSETVTFIINSPFKVADKLMDVMAEFGFKKEEKQKHAARPAEHRSNGGGPKAEEKQEVQADNTPDDDDRDKAIPAEPVG